MKLKLIITGILIIAASIGCGRDNNAVIKDKILKAEKLKEKGNEQEAMESLLQASNLIDDNTPLNLQTETYTELGGLFYEKHKIEDARRYFQKAIDVARAYDSIASYPHLLWNLVLTVNDKDSLKNILSECRDLSDLDREKYNFLAMRSRRGLARVYIFDNNIEMAKSILDSISSSVQTDSILKTETIIEKANIYLAEDDLENGIALLLSLEKLSLDGNTERSRLLYEAYKAMGDYRSALNYRDSLSIYTDSIQSIKSSEQISRIEREYNQQLAKEQKERNTIIFAGCAFFILMLILVLLLNRSRILKARQVSLINQISSLNLELSHLKGDSTSSTERKSDAIVSKLRLCKELFKTQPQYRLISQANLERNAEDISKDKLKELYDSLIAQFSDICNNLKAEYPALSSEDMMLCVMTYVGINKDVISVLLRSSDDALRQRKSRLKKKIPTELFDLFFWKTM